MSLPSIGSGFISSQNRQLIDTIKRSLPLPAGLSNSLASYVATNLSGLLIAAGSPLLKLDNSGRFIVSLTLRPVPQNFPALPSQWRLVRQPGGIEFQSSRLFTALRGNRPLSSRHLDTLGLSSSPSEPVIRQCCASLAEAIEGGRLADTRMILEEVFSTRTAETRLLYAALGGTPALQDKIEIPKPLFESVWTAFKKKGINSQEHIANIIGGMVEFNSRIELGSAQWKNFCVVRMSYALNKAGSLIPFIKGKTSSGRDGSWHLFRIPDFEAYLNGLWGAPDIIISGKRGMLDLTPISGKQGILHMDTRGQWQDASGHFTLWNGKVTRDDSDKYFAYSHKVQLWELP